MQPLLTLPAPLRQGLCKPLKKETLIMTTTTTRVRLYDIDTGAYDVSSDGNSVDIYGAAYFAGAALDPVSFRLILTRADNENPEGAAMIVFNDEELAAAGLGLANETAEAALLDALRTPGYQTAGAPAVLTRCLIDNYLEPEKAGAGSSERLITASGYQVFIAPSDDWECSPDSADVYVFEHYSDDMPAATATDCEGWAAAEDQLHGYTPDAVLFAVRRWHYRNETAWAAVTSLSKYCMTTR